MEYIRVTKENLEKGRNGLCILCAAKKNKELCKKELEWCREHSEIICNKVNVIREKYLAKEGWSGRDRCLDFLKLEEECVRFNKRSKKDHFPDND